MSSVDVMAHYDDSDEDTVFQTRKSKNRLQLSDSEEDNATPDNVFTGTTDNDDVHSEKEDSESNSSKPKIIKKKKRIVTVVSDSEDETTQEKTNNSDSSVEEKSPMPKNSRTAEVNSDSNSGSSSNEEDVKSKRVVPSKQKFKDVLFNKLHKKKSKDGSKKSSVPQESKISENQFTNKDLYDAESSEEERADVVSDEPSMEAPAVGKSKVEIKKKPQEKPAQRKSSAEALEKIHAETQRLIRESNVSLPYFLPKPTSISEFLQGRKPIPAIPLRAKGESLGSYINLYEERVKSITETFQHMSEDEEEDEKVDTKEGNKENLTNNTIENIDSETVVENNDPETVVENNDSEMVINKENSEIGVGKAVVENVGKGAEIIEGLTNGSKTDLSKKFDSEPPETISEGCMDSSKSDVALIAISSNHDSQCNQTNEIDLSDSQRVDKTEVKSNVNRQTSSGDENSENAEILLEEENSHVSNKSSEEKNEMLGNLQITNRNDAELKSNELVLENERNTETEENFGDSISDNIQNGLSRRAGPSPKENLSSVSTSQQSPDPKDEKSNDNQESTASHNQQKLDKKQQRLNSNERILKNNEQIINDNQRRLDENQQELNDIQKKSKESQPITSDKQQRLYNNQQRLDNNEKILYGNEQIISDNQQRLDEFQQKLDNNEQRFGESDGHQNSECNLFDTELMDEAEYLEEVCDDLDAGSCQGANKDFRSVVKKKLFSEYTASTHKAPNDREDVLRKQVTLRPANDSEDNFIELDDDATVKPANPNLKPGVLKLMERFSKHVSAKTPKPKAGGQTVSINITTTERDSQGEITGYSSEALSIVLHDDVSLALAKQTGDSKPGAKLMRLKEELDKEMARKREEAWKRRIEEAKMDEEMYEGEKSECGDNEEEFDDEENDLEDITTEEDEEEEDIVEKPRKKRVKSDFVDEEAEVSDEDEEEGDEDEDEDEEEEKEEKNEEEGCQLSEDEKLEAVEKESPRSLKSKTKTFDMFATQRNEAAVGCDDDEELPAYQLAVRSTACTPAPNKVVFSPVVSLTVAKNQDASFMLDTSQNPSRPSSPPSHQKKLNFDSLEIEPALSGSEQPSGLGTLLPTQPGADLEALFSGQFTSQPLVPEKLEANDDRGLFDTQTQPVPQGMGSLLGNNPSSDLSGLCSGVFTSQPLDPKQLEANDATCDRFLTTLSATGTEEGDERRQDETHKLLLNKSSILSSDDEDEGLDTSISKKKPTKTPKRLVYSDDEEESDKETGEEDEEDEEAKEKNGEEIEVDESDLEENGELDELDYDSEENEVVAKKVDDFFEAEAELSESEWGSEDEDENEMDKMEMEEADKEFHDQDQLKEELGKIHMKQVLDDDNREVRMLQEILLEDGELHSEGPGRQRQFKWSNLDDNSDLRITAHLSGDSEPEEEPGEESKEDEAWRQARLDRELYLESQKDKLELAESIQEESSYHAELAKTVILNEIKTKPARPEAKVISEPAGLPTKSPDSKLHALMGLHKKRGSYLARGNHSLVRLAKITSSLGDDNENKVLIKKKGNFVFSALEAPGPSGQQPTPALDPPESPKPNTKVQIKRKKSLATPPLLKKLKMHDGSKSSVLSKLMQASDF